MPIRFNVFGSLIDIERRAGLWQAWYPGTDGKRRPADIVVPADVTEDELACYLGDLLHEDARPGRDQVRRL